MDGRKRPAGPRSRDNSPPSQRRRRSELSFRVDRVRYLSRAYAAEIDKLPKYANTAFPRGPSSSPNSRKNSAVGLPAKVRTGPASYPSSERHVDQNRPSSNRDASHDYEKLQNDAATANARMAPSTDLSPRHVMSPMSNVSGSNTPEHSAPTVPSMLPVQNRKSSSHNAPMENLKALHERKKMIAANLPQSTNGISAMEAKALKAQVRLLQTEDAKSRNKIKTLEDQIKQFEGLPTQLAALKSQFENQNHAAAQEEWANDIKSRLSDLENPKSDTKSGLTQLQFDVNTLKLNIEKSRPYSEQLKQLQADVSEHKTNLAKVSTRTVKLETDMNDVAGIMIELRAVKEDIKIVKEQQRQAMKGDTVKSMIQTAMQPEIQKMTTFRTKNDKTLKDMSTKLSANETFCSELKKQNLPQQLQTLQTDQGSLRNEHDSLHTEHGRITDQIKNLNRRRVEMLDQSKQSTSEQSKLSRQIETIASQFRNLQDHRAELKAGHDNVFDQIKNLEKQQTRLFKEYQPVAEQVEKICTGQNSLFGQQRSMQAELNTLSDEQRGFTRTLKRLEDHVTVSPEAAKKLKLIESEQARLAKEQNTISDRIAKLESEPRPDVAPKPTVGNIGSNPSSTELLNIQQRLQALEGCLNDDEGSVLNIINTLQDDVGSHGEKIHNNERNTDLLLSNFVALFKQNFDPFQRKVEKQMEDITQCLDRATNDIIHLKQQNEDRLNEAPAPGLTAAQLTVLNTAAQDTIVLRQDLENLQKLVDNETTNRSRAVQDLIEGLATKQDTLVATKATDTVKAAIRNLQTQYDNISTDELHQRMVYWFSQTFTSSSADLIRKVTSLTSDVAQLRLFTNQIEWIPQYRRALESFVQVEPQLQSLVRSASTSDDSPKVLAVTNEALSSLKETMSQAQQKHVTLSRTVDGLQKSMHALNSSDSPFAKSASLMAMESSIRELRADLDAGFEEDRKARNEFRDTFSVEHEQRIKEADKIKLLLSEATKRRVEAEHGILLSVNDRFKQLEAGKIKTTSDQVERLLTDLIDIRDAFKTMLTRFIHPNEDFLDRLVALFVTVGELQHFIGDLNQNLPKGPLELSWTYDFNHVPSIATASEGDDGPKEIRQSNGRQ